MGNLKDDQLDAIIGNDAEKDQDGEFSNEFEDPAPPFREPVDEIVDPDVDSFVQRHGSPQKPHPDAEVSPHFLGPGKGVAQNIPEENRQQHHQNKDAEQADSHPGYPRIQRIGKGLIFFHA